MWKRLFIPMTYLILVPTAAYAGPGDAPPEFTLRLAKTADSSDADKPAIVALQRSDGGKSDYLTQGAIKGEHDFGPQNLVTVSPVVSWNRNTLASTPTDTWSYGVGLKYNSILDSKLEKVLVYSGNISQQRDLVKNTNAAIIKANVDWYGWPEWKGEGTVDYAVLRPSLMLFAKNVYSAQVDKTTGFAPTGTMSGIVGILELSAAFSRWAYHASTQALKPNQVVAGDTKYTHFLHTASITYQFVNPPTIGPLAKEAKVIPGISLIRQVGDDPLNAVSRAGFTQLVLSLRY